MTTRYFEIRTPQSQFTGRIGGIAFADGRARVQFDDTRTESVGKDKRGRALPGRVVSDEAQVSPGRSIVMFAKRKPGYIVTELDANGDPIGTDEGGADSAEVPVKPGPDAGVSAWRKYVAAAGIISADEAAKQPKDQLIALVAEAEKGADA